MPVSHLSPGARRRPVQAAGRDDRRASWGHGAFG